MKASRGAPDGTLATLAKRAKLFRLVVLYREIRKIRFACLPEDLPKFRAIHLIHAAQISSLSDVVGQFLAER
jgi:hypothetical protein